MLGGRAETENRSRCRRYLGHRVGSARRSSHCHRQTWGSADSGPAIVGSLLALWRPEHRGFLSVAAALIALTAGVSLIGGVGLLYVPSIVLLIWSAIPKSAPQGT